MNHPRKLFNHHPCVHSENWKECKTNLDDSLSQNMLRKYDEGNTEIHHTEPTNTKNVDRIGCIKINRL